MAALFILLLLAHGWWMTHMAPRPERLAHYAGHSAMGFDLLEHDPENACPGLDPGWVPVFGKDHAPTVT